MSAIASELPPDHVLINRLLASDEMYEAGMYLLRNITKESTLVKICWANVVERNVHKNLSPKWWARTAPYTDREGNTALIHACKTGDGAAAQRLLTLDLMNNGAVTRDGKKNTALILACGNRMSRVALRLLDADRAGCRPGHVNANGVTALMIACWCRMSMVAMELLRRMDCRPEQVGACGNTALTMAVTMASRNTSYKAAMLEVVARLLDVSAEHRPAQVSQTNDRGDTALSLACQRNMPEVVRKLLDTN